MIRARHNRAHSFLTAHCRSREREPSKMVLVRTSFTRFYIFFTVSHFCPLSIVNVNYIYMHCTIRTVYLLIPLFRLFNTLYDTEKSIKVRLVEMEPIGFFKCTSLTFVVRGCQLTSNRSFLMTQKISTCILHIHQI